MCKSPYVLEGRDRTEDVEENAVVSCPSLPPRAPSPAHRGHQRSSATYKPGRVVVLDRFRVAKSLQNRVRLQKLLLQLTLQVTHV